MAVLLRWSALAPIGSIVAKFLALLFIMLRSIIWLPIVYEVPPAIASLLDSDIERMFLPLAVLLARPDCELF